MPTRATSGSRRRGGTPRAPRVRRAPRPFRTCPRDCPRDTSRKKGRQRKNPRGGALASAPPRGSGSFASRLDGDDVEGLGALLALAGLELDLGALGEGLEALTADAAVVDEKVLASVLRRDEAVALRVVEPLHGSCCHISTPPYQ